MHEIGLCEGIVSAVRTRAAGRPVARVRVRAGIRLRVVEESLAQAFALLAADTEAEDAAVELTEVPAQAYCPECGFQGDVTDVLTACPRCGAAAVELTGGDELVLESLTLGESAGSAPVVQKG